MKTAFPTLGTLVLCLALPLFPALGNAQKLPAYDWAIELLAAGEQPAAEKTVEQACATNWVDPDLWFLRGVLERSRFSKYDAGTCLTIAWSLDPTTYRAEAAKTILFMDRNKKVDEGFQTLEKLIAEHPEDLLIRWLFAIECREHKWGQPRSRAEEGARQYETILKEWNPGPVLIHQTYANILSEQLGRHEEALVHRKIAVEQSYKAWTCQGYGNTLRKLGRFDEAVEWLEKAVELAPDDPAYKRSLKSAQQEKRRQEKATTPLKKAQLFSGGYAKNLPKALELYEQAAEEGDASAYIKMGIIYRNGGEGVPKNQAKAAECFEKGYDAGLWHCANLLGIMYGRGLAGSTNEELALEWYKKGAQHNQQTSLRALIYYYAAHHDPNKCDAEKARTYLDQLKKLNKNPDSIDVRSLEAITLAREGKFDEAIVIQQKIVEEYGDKRSVNGFFDYITQAKDQLACYRAGEPWIENYRWPALPTETKKDSNPK